MPRTEACPRCYRVAAGAVCACLAAAEIGGSFVEGADDPRSGVTIYPTLPSFGMPPHTHRDEAPPLMRAHDLVVAASTATATGLSLSSAWNAILAKPLRWRSLA